MPQVSFWESDTYSLHDYALPLLNIPEVYFVDRLWEVVMAKHAIHCVMVVNTDVRDDISNAFPRSEWVGYPGLLAEEWTAPHPDLACDIVKVLTDFFQAVRYNSFSSPPWRRWDGGAVFHRGYRPLCARTNLNLLAPLRQVKNTPLSSVLSLK